MTKEIEEVTGKIGVNILIGEGDLPSDWDTIENEKVLKMLEEKRLYNSKGRVDTKKDIDGEIKVVPTYFYKTNAGKYYVNKGTDEGIEVIGYSKYTTDGDVIKLIASTVLLMLVGQ